MKQIILQIKETTNRPESMQVRISDDTDMYLVQAYNSSKKWITLSEHRDEKEALLTCIKWY